MIEDVNKMKDVDLKNMINEQVLSTAGNKQELIDPIINCSEFAVLDFEKTVGTRETRIR